jgi:hypothetical protein
MGTDFVSSRRSPGRAPRGGHQAVPRHQAEQGPHRHRAVQPVGDLRVASDEGDAQIPAGVADLRHQPLGHSLVGGVLGQEQGDQQPARYGAGGGEVVGVDLDQIGAEVVGSEGNRVGLAHQKLLAQVNHRAVETHARPHQHPRVVDWGRRQETSEYLRRQLADGERWCFAIAHEVTVPVLRRAVTTHRFRSRDAPRTGAPHEWFGFEAHRRHLGRGRRRHADPFRGERVPSNRCAHAGSLHPGRPSSKLARRFLIDFAGRPRRASWAGRR